VTIRKGSFLETEWTRNLSKNQDFSSRSAGFEMTSTIFLQKYY